MRHGKIVVLALLLVATLFLVAGVQSSYLKPVKIIGFGDSWLLHAPLRMEKNIVIGARYDEIEKMIKDHKGGREYVCVVILGGIMEVKKYGATIESCDWWPKYIKQIAKKKFPNAEIIVVSIEDICDTLERFDRDGLHTDANGYEYLLAKYPIIGDWQERLKEQKDK